MCKMIENIKVNSLRKEKRKEYPAGKKHDVPEVVRTYGWARGCWEACCWKVKGLGTDPIALKFKKKQDLSCMRTKGMSLSYSYSIPILLSLQARPVDRVR